MIHHVKTEEGALNLEDVNVQVAQTDCGLDISVKYVMQKLLLSTCSLLSSYEHYYVVGMFSYAAICQPSCQNGGICTAPGRCECPPTHRGLLCHIREFNRYPTFTNKGKKSL